MFNITLMHRYPPFSTMPLTISFYSLDIFISIFLMFIRIQLYVHIKSCAGWWDQHQALAILA